MRKKYLSVAVVAALAMTSTDAAANTLPNGKPFQLLNDKIDQNAGLIEQNRLAIDALRTEVDTITGGIGDLEARVAANETSIGEAFTAIESANGHIGEIRGDLLALSERVDSSISDINDELATLNTSLSSLTTQMNTLKGDLESATAELNAAIDANSVDIATLFGLVSALNANLSVANSNILTLFGRINTLEYSVNNQQRSLNNLDSQIALLDDRVTALEACACDATTPDSREFTVYGTAADDYAANELRTKLASLHYARGEYLYAKTSNADGAYELCTNNSEAYDAVQAFINAGSFSRWASPTAQTRYRVASTGTWVRPSTVKVSASTSYYYDFFEFTFYGTMDVQSGLMENKHSRSGYVNHDVLSNSWDVYGDNALTIRAGATAQEACGIN